MDGTMLGVLDEGEAGRVVEDGGHCEDVRKRMEGWY